ncbi:MAG: GGDEF domain-containing protein [Alphaproteobacteria bacterium]|nr:GGDEF domain-containing protein [Alphaproteobacteria bacterium]
MQDNQSTRKLIANIRLVCREMKNHMFPGTSHFITPKRLAEVTLSIADEAQEKLQHLENRVKELEELATTDALTGTLNRRGFTWRMQHALSESKRFDERGFIIYIDIDNFKNVNDIHGHAAGDNVLKKVCEVLKDNMRTTDIIGRLGGDEFAVLMPRSEINAKDRIKQLEYMVNNSSIVHENNIISINASFGVGEFSGEEEIETVMVSADKDMYKQKLGKYKTYNKNKKVRKKVKRKNDDFSAVA